MHIAAVNSANALADSVNALVDFGAERGLSRTLEEPLVVTITRPDQRVRFGDDFDPFLHLRACLFAARGERNVRDISDFAPWAVNRSDDGRRFRAATGHRWAKAFRRDQVTDAIERLRVGLKPVDRALVVATWDPLTDHEPSLDQAAHLGLCLTVRADGTLDGTVMSPTDDVHATLGGTHLTIASFTLELIARGAGLPLGNLHWVTASALHLGTDRARPWSAATDPYALGWVEPSPASEVDRSIWVEDLETFARYGNVVGIRDRFFRRVCGPMMAAHRNYREADGPTIKFDKTLDILDSCTAADWATAAREWVQRRQKEWEQKTR